MSKFVNNKGYISSFIFLICLFLSTFMLLSLQIKISQYQQIKTYNESKDIYEEIHNTYINIKENKCDYYIPVSEFNKLNYYEYISKEEYEKIIKIKKDETKDACVIKINKEKYDILVLKNSNHIKNYIHIKKPFN